MKNYPTYTNESRDVRWDHPKPPSSFSRPSTTTTPISSAEFVSCWGARVHAEGRFFTYDEVLAMNYHHVWTVTDRHHAHIGVAALPGDFGDAYFGFCVTDRAWDWDFYQSAAGYAVVADDGDDADRRFFEEGVMPLPTSTRTAQTVTSFHCPKDTHED
nr:hypothetical protein [Stenotrophomonas maltophilia]